MPFYTIHDLHSKVSKEKKGKVVDARCRDLTNAVAANKAKAEPGSVEVCNFHEVGISLASFYLALHSWLCWKNMGEIPHDALLPPGIWTLADILQHGRDKSTCPYFTIRRSVCSRLLFSMTKGLIRASKDAIRRCHHLLLPLPARSEGSRASFKGDVERLHRRIR